MISDFLLLALRNLKKRGIRSWLTVLGVFIGIAAVISLISLGNALQTAIESQFNTLSTDTLTISAASTSFGPPGSTAVKKLNSRDLKIIESVQEVEIAIPILIRVVKVEFDDESQFRYVGSVPEDTEKLKEVRENYEIQKGDFIELGEVNKVVLGNDFVDFGQFGNEIRVGDEIIIQGKKFEVGGFLKKGSSFQTNSVILMLENELKNLLDIEDEIDLITAKVRDETMIEQAANEVKRKLRRDKDQDPGEEDFEVETPGQSLESVSTILSVISVIVSGIAAISLLVGGIGIANTMFTSVLERRREIGIMKAIGAKNSDILYIFMIESALIGLVGGVVGVVLGLSLAFGASYIAQSAFPGISFEILISLPLIFGAVAFALTIGLISGIFPALQASKLKPVDALRK